MPADKSNFRVEDQLNGEYRPSLMEILITLGIVALSSLSCKAAARYLPLFAFHGQ